ncbi:MAG TPA: GtrA family protein [Pedococcus sp.]|nr:GtrA family protein [Pedococcus sp.]
MLTGLARLRDARVLRYLLIGGSSFVLDLGLLTLGFRTLHWPLWVATAAGFWGSFFYNYLLQRRFSFHAAGSQVGSLVRYSVLLAFNTVATIAIVGFFQRIGWGYVTGKVIATGATTIWNYFAYKEWVFVAGTRSDPPLSPYPAD